MNLELLCLLDFLLQYIDIELKEPASIIAPEILTTEKDSADIWASEKRCNCDWNVDAANRTKNRHIKRLPKYRNLEASYDPPKSERSDIMNDWHSTPTIIDSSDDDLFMVIMLLVLFFFFFFFVNLISYFSVGFRI